MGALATLMLSTSCASIVSNSKYNVSINSNPSQATVRVLDRKGSEVASGQTPVTFKLKAGSGFFRSAKYTLVFSKDGYEDLHIPLNASLDPWFFGNLVFGGFIGFLIVDPATGAMWKIEDDVINMSLKPAAPLPAPVAIAKHEASGKVMNVYALSDVPNELRERMIPIKNK